MTALERAIARPDPVREFGARSPLHGLDRQSVGFVDVLAQSVAAVAPAAAATTVVLLVAGISPSATVLSILVAGVLSFLVARTISQFARRFAAAGSTYTYTARGLGVGAGLASGAAILVGYGAIAMFALFGGAYYLTFLLGAILPGTAGPVTTALVLLAEAAFVALVLVRGIRVSSRIALVVEVISVALIVVMLIILLVQIGPINPAVLVPAAGEWSPAAIAAGSVIALTAFVGFESSATLGVEARSPLRTVPRAIVWTVILSGGLYLLASITQVAGFAALDRELSESASPINELAAAYGMDMWATLADAGIAASFLACAIGSTTALTRVLFTMGRDGVLPRAAGRAHRRFGTPIGAIWLSLPVITIAPLLVTIAGMEIRDAMHITIALGGVGYIVAYIFVCVSAPLFLRRIGELTVGSAVIAGVSAVALTGGLVAFLVVDAASGSAAIWVVLAVAVAAAIVIIGRIRGDRRSLDGIGAYDEPIASQVLGGVARDGRTTDA
ncbi:amino acid transporter [Microbacterium endophyticum]|uniref:Amino acid transporter n=1 Tax=Microbacterium endophyticum TaxID=1526412 RepID=A0A7W4V1L1_9MICO|nr:APC family permease [Microbacterium endophyticum]MBB2975162.1 amino acid transporter [Microbacterium endophyticum]NIK37298.1 amino acid transporter [Microbacterium endophyticum]